MSPPITLHVASTAGPGSENGGMLLQYHRNLETHPRKAPACGPGEHPEKSPVDRRRLNLLYMCGYIPDKTEERIAAANRLPNVPKACIRISVNIKMSCNKNELIALDVTAVLYLHS